MIVAQVRYNKCNGQKVLTVPKGCKLQPGDIVKLVKLEE